MARIFNFNSPEPKECLKCGRISPPESETCDCGYRFDALLDAVHHKTKRLRDAGLTTIAIGLTVLLSDLVWPPRDSVDAWFHHLTDPVLIIFGILLLLYCRRHNKVAR